MNFERVRVIIEKEWAEVFKNRMVLVTVVILPVIFTILPLVILSTMNSAGGMDYAQGSSSDIPQQFAASCGDLSAADCMRVYLLNTFMMMFMMMPLIIPTAFAAYSIVGEKTTRSLEPLLATPVTTFELLAGKSLAAAIPAIVVSWVSFLVFLLLLPLAGGTPAVIQRITGPTWLLAVMVIGPLMAIAAVNVAVFISSRINDPRAAEQISGVLVVPLMALLFGQMAGVIVLNVQVMLIAIIVMVAVDITMVYFGARLFQRETILTRWK